MSTSFEKSGPSSQVTHCIECGRPWGVILGRTEEPSDELAELARAAMVESWVEVAECDHEGGTRFDTDRLPQVTAMRIVYLTEALARFCDDNGICEPTFLDDCWQDIEDVDLPRWLLKGRKQRWAYGWDCCEIGGSDNYVMELIDAG